MTATNAFTMDQIKEIYAAGVRRGEVEAGAYNAGCAEPGKTTDDLVEALHDIWNDGKAYDDPTYRHWDVIEALVNAPTPDRNGEADETAQQAQPVG